MRIGGMAAFVVALAIGLAFSLGLWGSWTAGAAGTEHIVNQDTGTGDPAPCDDPDFPSVSDIETVIDDADVADGDTLILCPGTYAAGAGGTVEVDKELTITGLATADREDVVVQGSSHGFTIKADDVTIRHLKLVGAGADIGIRIGSDANALTIQDMEITAWSVGVSMQGADGNVVETSNIHANVDRGVAVADGAENVIRNNEIKDNTNHGIDIKNEDQLLVDSNSLTGNGGAQIDVQAESNAFIWNNNIEATANIGVLVGSATADTLVQIGGSPQRTNNFTGTLAAGGFYVRLNCVSENTVDATYNYWNGINSNAGISPVVFNDEFDDPATGPDCAGDNKGAVVVHPFVTTMWTPTPTPTPSPTPTVTATPTATVTPTPTGTPSGATRTVNLSPQGWQTLIWSGPDATDPAVALGLSCISGKYAIAYEWAGTATPAQWLRYVPGLPLLSNITVVNKYDSLLVLITAAGVTCDMPVTP
jgi:parallel beta-helix repeat protein